MISFLFRFRQSSSLETSVVPQRRGSDSEFQQARPALTEDSEDEDELRGSYEDVKRKGLKLAAVFEYYEPKETYSRILVLRA